MNRWCSPVVEIVEWFTIILLVVTALVLVMRASNHHEAWSETREFFVSSSLTGQLTVDGVADASLLLERNKHYIFHLDHREHTAHLWPLQHVGHNGSSLSNYDRKFEWTPDSQWPDVSELRSQPHAASAGAIRIRLLTN